jgi:hypothetical protein
MLNRKSIFALAAVSALAVAALAPTDASAMRGGFGGRGFGGGGFGGGHFGGGFGGRSFGGRSFGGGGFGHTFARPVSFARIPTGFGHRGFDHTPPLRITETSRCDFHRCGPPTTPPGNHCLIDCGPPNNPPCLINCGGHLPPPIVWWKHHPHWGVVEYQAALPVGDVDGVATPVAADAAVAAGPCNCLTKQYLDDGSVLFKDICTKEAALATPDELKAQAQGVAPQAQAN